MLLDGAAEAHRIGDGQPTNRAGRMMGQVFNLVAPESIDAAWHDYANDARRLSAEPHLIADRSFNELLARKHERWRKLFLMQDGGR